MKNRIFALLICMAVLVSAIGCGGSQKSDDSASKAEAVAEEEVVGEAPASPAEEAVPEESHSRGRFAKDPPATGKASQTTVQDSGNRTYRHQREDNNQGTY